MDEAQTTLSGMIEAHAMRTRAPDLARHHEFVKQREAITSTIVQRHRAERIVACRLAGGISESPLTAQVGRATTGVAPAARELVPGESGTGCRGAQSGCRCRHAPDDAPDGGRDFACA